jgi:hypothetical protein
MGAPPREETAAACGATATAANAKANDTAAKPAGSKAARQPAAKTDSKAASPEGPREPGWLTDLEGTERGRARRLIERLAEDGLADAEGIVRRDVVGDVPALAAHAIARHLADLGDDAAPDEVAALLADGRDERLGVRWRLVDGEGRPILLESARRRR